MPTTRQTANLRRGGAPATPAAAARAKAARDAHRANDVRLGEVAREDGWAAYSELHERMARNMSRMLRAEERAGGNPKPQVTARLRELRMGLEALTVYEQSKSPEDESAEFLATLDGRLAALGVLGQPQPVAEPVA
jgi:hypothetical protein